MRRRGLENVAIFAGRGAEDYVGNVIRILSYDGLANTESLEGQLELFDFTDTDPKLRILSEVSGRHVFFVTRYKRPTIQAWVDTMLFCNAANIQGAASVNVIGTYTGSSRSDREAEKGEAIGIQAKALSFQAQGMDRYFTFSIHAPGSAVAFDPSRTKFKSIPLWPVLVRVIHHLLPKEGVRKFVAPDTNAAKDTREIINCSTVKGSNLYSRDLAIIDKDRIGVATDESEAKALIGNVKGYHVIIADDEANTAGTLKDAAEICKESGALSVSFMAAHPKYGGGFKGVKVIANLLDAGHLDFVLTGNTCEEPTGEMLTLMHDPRYQNKFITIPTEPLVADLIQNVASDTPYGHLFSSRRVLRAYDRLEAMARRVETSTRDYDAVKRVVELRNALAGPVLGLHETRFNNPID
jgi:ribose-phosphate pyrophosphokinase